MPIFSYICNACGEKFDLLLGVASESQEIKCKRCGSKNIRKTFAPFAVSVSSGRVLPEPTCPTGPCPGGPCSPGSCPLG